MNTKKLIFLLLLLTVTVTVSTFAQKKASVKWGTMIDQIGIAQIFYIGSDENSHYVLLKKDGSSFIVINRLTMESSKPRKIDVPSPGDGSLSVNNIYYLNDHLILVVKINNKKDKTDTFYGYSMDKKGSVGKDYIKLFTTEEGADGFFGHFMLSFSPDSKSFLIGAYNIHNGFNLTCATFTYDLKPIWKQDVDINALVKGKNNSILDYCLDNESNLFLMVKASNRAIYTNERENVFCVYNQKSKQWNTTLVTPPDKLKVFEAGQFACDSKGKVWFTGLYCKTNDDFFGTAITVYEEGQTKTTFTPFSSKFLSAFMSDAKAKNTGNSFSKLTIDFVIPNSDNSFEVLIHRHYNLDFDEHYNLDFVDITSAAAIKFDADIKEVWSAPIPINLLANSVKFKYNTFATEKELISIYYDHKKNEGIIDPRETTSLSTLANAVGVITHINLENGKVTKETVPITNDIEMVPLKCHLIDTDEILLLGEIQKKVGYGRLSWR